MAFSLRWEKFQQESKRTLAYISGQTRIRQLRRYYLFLERVYNIREIGRNGVRADEEV